MKTAIYVDFDNIYGGILDKLGIPADPKLQKKVTNFQIHFLKEVLSKFFRQLKETLVMVEPIHKSNHDPLCIKVFAEYENLPLSIRFSPGMPIFLYNIGVVPVNPFIASSKKKKNRNAADVSLVLTAIEDLIVKSIPADAVIICTCDIDLYPLILWLREHTGKEIILGGFSDRTSRLYDAVLVGRRLELEFYLEEAVREVFYSFNSPEIAADWLSQLKESDLEFLKNLMGRYKLSENLLVSRYKSEFSVRKEEVIKTGKLKEEKVVDTCEEFKAKLLEGLRDWLEKREYASTGLIIKSWLPEWGLDIDVLEANKCLEKIIKDKENLNKRNLTFEMESLGNGFIKGKFLKLERNSGGGDV